MQELILPLLIGATGVLQNTLNKKFAESIGIVSALLINATVLLTLALTLYVLLRTYPNSFPAFFRLKEGAISPSWKYIFPGLFGFFIIVTAPIAINRIGATKVFLGIIVAQMITSILWDYYVEAMQITWPKIIGTALAVLGAAISVL